MIFTWKKNCQRYRSQKTQLFAKRMNQSFFFNDVKKNFEMRKNFFYYRIFFEEEHKTIFSQRKFLVLIFDNSCLLQNLRIACGQKWSKLSGRNVLLFTNNFVLYEKNFFFWKNFFCRGFFKGGQNLSFGWMKIVDLRKKNFFSLIKSR